MKGVTLSSTRLLLPAFTLLCALPTSAGAQTDRPEAARRTVVVWDFEGDDGLFEPVPRGWFRAQDNPTVGRDRPGFPAFNAAILSAEAAASGRFSMRLPTRGGSTSLMLSAGVLPAIPDADYAVVARVRTQGVVYARARLSAWLLDAHLRPIPGTRAASAPVVTLGRWDVVETTLRGRPEAAWIQLELELLQPDLLAARLRLPHEVRRFDVTGDAWFDDVVVYQVPRLDLTMSSSSNFIVEPEQPELVALIRDMTGESLTQTIRVFDMNGREVATSEEPVVGVGRPSSWRPALPGYGWYRASLSVSGGKGVVGERWIDFVWAPPAMRPEAAGSRSFALIAERLSDEQRESLPALVQRVGTGAITLAAWNDQTSEETLESSVAALSRTTERLLELQQDVTFALTTVPVGLAQEARVDRNNPIPVLLGDGDNWLPYLTRVLTKFGERVERWQLGGTGENLPFFRPDLPSEVASVLATLRTLVPRPSIALPWGLDQGVPADIGPTAALAVTWPPAAHPDAIDEAVARWPDGIGASLVLHPLDKRRFGRAAAVNDLVRRATLAWAAGVRSLALSEPWSDNPDDPSMLMPSAELAVWRTLASALTGRTIVGELPVGEGARAFIAQGARDSVLIAWNDSAQPQDAVVRGYLGSSAITLRDPFGNTRPLLPDESGSYAVPLAETPVFIEGIDVALARFRAGLRIEPRFIPARAEKHRVDLVVENPWPIPVSGRLRIAEPQDWQVSPRVVALNLGAERTVRIPLELSFNLGEEAGPQRILAEVELIAERRYPIQLLPLALEIGLPSVELIPSVRYERGADGTLSDIIVHARIINRTDKPITLEAFAQAPGYKNFFLPVSQLEPGGSAVRVFRFENGVQRLRGRSIRVGVKEQDGTGRLNKTLIIE